MSEAVTFNEMEEVCASIAAQRAVIDVLSEQKKEEDRKLAEMEKKLLELLSAVGKSSFQSQQGTFSISHRMSVKIPALPEDKQAFFSYLKEKGIFENMVSVHSATLNSFYKAEFEAARERGEGLDFAIPGIGMPNVNEIISFRAIKK